MHRVCEAAASLNGYTDLLPHSSSSSSSPPARQTAAAQESPSSSRHSTGAWRPPEAGPSSSSCSSGSSRGMGGGIMNISPGLTPLKMRLLIGPKCRRRALSSSADLRGADSPTSTLRTPLYYADAVHQTVSSRRRATSCFSGLVSGGGRSPYMVSLAVQRLL